MSLFAGNPAGPRDPTTYRASLVVAKDVAGIARYDAWSRLHAGRLKELREIARYGNTGMGGVDDTYDECVPEELWGRVEAGRR
jgi:hypothetical protein